MNRTQERRRARMVAAEGREIAIDTSPKAQNPFLAGRDEAFTRTLPL